MSESSTTTVTPVLLDPETNFLVAVTPYKASVLVNQVLEPLNLNPIPPQMMYNYTTARVNKGKTPFIPITPKGILLQDLNEWVAKYVAKKVAKS